MRPDTDACQLHASLSLSILTACYSEFISRDDDFLRNDLDEDKRAEKHITKEIDDSHKCVEHIERQIGPARKSLPNSDWRRKKFGGHRNYEEKNKTLNWDSDANF
jgi:hypothetical protein